MMTGDAEIRANLKRLIIQSLNLEGMAPESIGDDQQLFGSGLGLDSVDALELMVAIEKQYKIRIEAHTVERSAFASVASLAALVAARLAEGVTDFAG